MILKTLSAGAGAPVVLLHGLFGAARNLGGIARALARRFRVLSMDLRNHGESPRAAAMDYPAMAADVAETCAARGVPAAAVIGHSMGGKTAMMLALTRPDVVGRLAVLDIAPIAYHHGYDDFVAAMQAVPLRADLTRHEADAVLAPGVPDARVRAFLLASLVLGDTPHWRLALPEIAAAMPDLVGWPAPAAPPYAGPALFLSGGMSDYVPPRAEPEIAQLFPGARRQTIPGTGHWLHAEQPEAVIAALEEFLA